MTIREAIRAEWKSVKNRTPKERFAYFREYYGMKTIVVAIAVVLLIAFVITMVTKKEYGYSGVFFGATPQSSADQYLSDFAQAAGIDPEVYELSIQSSLDIRMNDKITEETYQAMQSFAAMVAANMVDNVAADVDLFLYYSYLGYMADLRTILTEAQLAELAPYLHYIDGKLLEEQNNSDEGLTFEYGQCPDSRKPEAMVNPIPVGIDLSAATDAFHSSYTFSSKVPVIGICASSEHPGSALAFLQYALGLPVTTAFEAK